MDFGGGDGGSTGRGRSSKSHHHHSRYQQDTTSSKYQHQEKPSSSRSSPVSFIQIIRSSFLFYVQRISFNFIHHKCLGEICSIFCTMQLFENMRMVTRAN